MCIDFDHYLEERRFVAAEDKQQNLARGLLHVGDRPRDVFLPEHQQSRLLFAFPGRGVSRR